MADATENSNPPNFETKWLSDNELQVTYKSERGLIDLVVPMLKYIGKKYNEKITVEKLNEENDIKVIFEK